jgi:hypothetical protein
MKKVTREQAVEALRQKLLTLVDDEHSMCEVATRLGIFCHGFAQDTAGGLRKRYGWIVRNRPGVKKAELEDLANRWQLARQRVLDTPLCCDIQASGREAHSTCLGWSGMSDEQLARFHRELLGEEIEILPPAESVPA